MAHFLPERERCPFCGAKGECRIFAHYERSVIEIIGGKVFYRQLRITRVICSCGHTHAILPDFLVPYDQYSLPFILQVLHIYLLRQMTVSRICEIYAISHSMLYRWISVFQTHKRWYLGALISSETTDVKFMEGLLDTEPLSSFLGEFLLRTLFSFLQTHANPANCAHRPPG